MDRGEQRNFASTQCEWLSRKVNLLALPSKSGAKTIKRRVEEIHETWNAIDLIYLTSFIYFPACSAS